MKKHWLAVLIMIIVLVPWAANADKFFYILNAKYSDLTVSHLPNAIYLLNELKSSGEIPLWSNAILSGAPFAADPLSGIWYPPGWFAYFLPQPMGFNITALLHILWGGLGMFLLLLGLKLKREAALMGGMAFLLMPKLFSHLAAGHVTLVYAVSWTPWLFLAEIRCRQLGGTNFIQRISPGLVLGLIFLADPRWSFYAATAWLGYSLWQMTTRDVQLSGSHRFKSWLPGLGLQTITAVAISAVLLIPMLEFTRLSTRSSMTSADVLAFSLPPSQLAGLILPNIGGYAEWQVYPGAFIFLLAVYALFVPHVRKKAAFWLVLAGLAVVVSLGSLWPFAGRLAELPVFSLLRVPSRAWFLTGMGLIVTAALMLNEFLTNPPLKQKLDPMIILLPLAGLAIFLDLGLIFLGETPPVGFIWGAAALTISVILIFLLRRQVPKAGLITAAILFMTIDLAGVNWYGMTFRTSCDVMAEGFEAANFLARQPGEFRVYSPSYSIPQHTGAVEDLERIDGINPLQLAAYSEYMSQASGVDPGGYSVTIPGFASGDPATDNVQAKPNTKMLGLLNGKYVAAEFEMVDPRLEEIWRNGETRIYENLDTMPRAWVQKADEAPGNGLLSEVKFEKLSSNEVIAQADGPGLAVFSMPDYPGWQVWVDGNKAEKMRIADLLIGVNLENGSHQITLKFVSKTTDGGLIISSMAWIMILIIGLAPKFVKKKAGEIEED